MKKSDSENEDENLKRMLKMPPKHHTADNKQKAPAKLRKRVPSPNKTQRISSRIVD
jgi:hypothetical protein